jgi:hypothetical protein
MRRTVRALIVGSLIAATAGLVVARRMRAGQPGARERGAPMRPLRTFVVRSFNPLVVRLRLAGGPRSPWGLIEHVGRTSGHVYRSPVSPRPIEGGFEIPLPYGADVHWVCNVLAAGRARIQLHDTIYELDRPEIVQGADAVSLAPPIRRLAGRVGYRYLRVRTVAAMPGTFSHLEGHPAPVTVGQPVAMPSEGPFAEFLGPAAAGAAVPVEPKMVEGVTERTTLTR